MRGKLLSENFLGLILGCPFMIKKVWLNPQELALISVGLSYFQSTEKFESQVLCVLLSDSKNNVSNIIMGCFH